MEHGFSSSAEMLIPANETERVLAVRSLLPLQDVGAAELDALTSLCKMIFRASLVAVTIIDEDRQYIAATAGVEIAGCARDQSVCTRIVYSGKPLIIEDLAAHPAFRDVSYVSGPPYFRFYAGTPLEVQPGVVVGALCVLDFNPRQLSEEECGVLSHMGAVASSLLRLQRSNVVLQRDRSSLTTAAMEDPLTGFYNRAALATSVDGMVARAVADGNSIGAIYMDVDRFKAVNDIHGHPVGDEVLAEAARRIRSVIRGNDVPLRLGGDEFALFFDGPCDVASMEKVAQRLIEVFRAPFEIDGLSIDARASVGIALAPQHASTRLELSRNADIALYEAKARGGDQYSVFKRAH
ncbi:diguanylate cyclase domain-containing protein [Rhizobium sp. RAF56]|jgi:diguanylate cyclase (GGDEF)-like protein|uniref:diguanylate cyclase domain-containing protein n=1 Tax=Rhizobium sp. RAF56 TaxID=3233062 RepID=UPI003F9C29E3